MSRGWYLASGTNGTRVYLDEIAEVAAYMIEQGDAAEVPYMIEKPWKFAAEAEAAFAARDEDTEVRT